MAENAANAVTNNVQQQQGSVVVNANTTEGNEAVPMFAPSHPGATDTTTNVDLDDLFRDCYFGDMPLQPFGSGLGESGTPIGATTTVDPTPVTAPISTTTTTTATTAALVPTVATTTTAAIATVPQVPTTVVATAPTVPIVPAPPQQQVSAIVAPPPSTTAKRTATEAGLMSPTHDDDDDDDVAHSKTSSSSRQLTDQQKVERRERNREHAKRSRLRKKFLLESLQEQIHGLMAEIDELKQIITKELPDKAEVLLQQLSSAKNRDKQFTPLPMPSGFGPVKTLMEPDFRLMSALSGSQQNFAISDPSLPDNPIVYVSQGFLDLTGYRLDQVLGRNCRLLQGPGTDQSAVDVIRRGIQEGVDTSVCLLNYKADGTPFWNQFFVAALRDAENNVVNFVGVQCEVSKAVVEKQLKDKQQQQQQGKKR